MTKNEYENEWERCEKIADKIHVEYKQNYKNKTLRDICKKNNMEMEDFLYIMGYQDIDEYLMDLKESENKKGSKNMKKLNNYEVAFRTSSCGITYKQIKAKNEEDVIKRLKAKNYRTDIIVNIRKMEDA